MAYVPYVPSPGLKPGKAPASKPAAAKPKAAPVKRVTDPYTDPQSYIAKAVAGLGTPLTDAQIQTNAQSQLAPLIKALQDSIKAQATSGTAAIGGYTSNLAQHLAGFQQNAQNIYGGAEASQAASDAALSQKLAGEGGQQAQDLGAKLAGINAPGAVNQAVQGATQTAGGAGNALYATGGASLANLIASGAAEQSYASKLPGIAGLAGAQQVGNLQGELAKSLADQTGTLQGKVPDIVNSLEGQRSDLLGKRATLTQDLQGFFSDRGYKQQALDQEAKALGQKTAAQRTSTRQAQQRINQQNTAQTERQRHDQATEQASRDRIVAQKAAAAAKAAKAKQPKPPKALSPSDLSRLSKLAHDFYNGVPAHQHYNTAKSAWEDVPGTGASAVKWNSAVAQLVAAGATPEKAKQLLVAQGWQPGEGGRPYATKAAGFKAKRSKPPAVGKTLTQPDGTYTYMGPGRGWVKK